jgi:hypothetical protein
MTQEQYVRLKPIRHHLDKLMDVGSINMPYDHAMILQDVHKELFGSNFNAWCQSCLETAMKSVFYQFDQYEKAGAPLIVTAEKTATVKTKRARKS